MPAYCAAITTQDDSDGFCSVAVLEMEIHGYDIDDDGNETPQWRTTDHIVFGPVSTTVRHEDPYKMDKAEEEAKKILAAAGWEPVSPELTIADNAIYFDVEHDDFPAGEE